MKVALIGRTHWMLEAAQKLLQAGHSIGVICTAKAEAFYQSKENDFKQLALQLSVPYYQSLDLNNDKAIQSIEKTRCGIAASVNWPYVLKEKICSIFPHGILNAHAGDLPRYRGNACPNWAILNGEPHVGLCLHQMEPGKLDSGPVYLRDHYSLNNNSYIGDVYQWLGKRIPDMFVEAVNGIESGDLHPVPQEADPALALRCYPRLPVDGLINWNESADEIGKIIRATSVPFDGAYTVLKNKPLKVWKAHVESHLTPTLGVPGQVIQIDSETGFVSIYTGGGIVVLEEVETEKEGRKLPFEIIKSHRLRLGFDGIKAILDFKKINIE